MNKPQNTKNGPANARAIVRRKKIMDLRLKGFTYEQIGAVLGTEVRGEGGKPISKEYVFQQVKKMLGEQRAELSETVEDLRQIQNMRMELMINRLFIAAFPSPSQGDKNYPDPRLDHVTALQRSVDSQSKLLGLNSADKVSLEVTRQAEEMVRTFAAIAKRYVPADRMNEFKTEVEKAFEFVKNRVADE
jgi:DNA-binding transcriptional MerR regulator